MDKKHKSSLWANWATGLIYRVVGLAFVTCLVLISLDATTISYGQTQTDGAFRFIDDFNEEAVGEAPSNWNVINKEGITGRPSTVLVKDLPDGTERTLEINMQETSATGQDPLATYQFDRALEGKVVIEGKIMMLDVDSSHQGMMIRDENNKNTTHLIRFSSDGFIYGYDGTQMVKVVEKPYNLNEWYHVSAVLDTNSKTYDLYIDGTKVSDGLSLFSNSLNNVMYLRLQAWATLNNSESTAYYDDIKVLEPGIRGIAPLEDTQNVDVNVSQLSIDFNTPMDTEDLGPDQVFLRNLDTGETVTNATYSVSAEHYIIHLTEPLKHGTEYEIMVDDVQDVYGNTIVTSFPFHTKLGEGTIQLSSAQFTRNGLGGSPELNLQQLKPGHISGQVNMTNLDDKSHDVTLLMQFKKDGHVVKQSFSQKEMKANETTVFTMGLNVPDRSNLADYQIEMFATRDWTSFEPVSNVVALGASELEGDNPARTSEIHFLPSDESAETIEAFFSESNRLTIQGQGTVHESSQVTVIVLDPEGAIHHLDETTSDSDGNYQFSYPFSEGALHGEYVVRVGGTGVVSGTIVQYTGSPIEDPITTSVILGLVNEFAEDGKNMTDSAAHALTLHLTAIEHYEKQEEIEKVIQHMGSFKLLLSHQLDREMISELAYSTLLSNTEALLERWE